MSSRRRFIVIVAIVASIPIVLAGAGLSFGIRVNLTPSYPPGLWRIVPIERDARTGDLIFICPPRTAAFASALERGYLRSGSCPGWVSPLIKRVVATAGQRVAVDHSVAIDGERLAHSDVRSADAQGRALYPYAGDLVPAGHLFLHSPYAGSYDSRYFGPIPADGVLGLAQPVLILPR